MFKSFGNLYKSFMSSWGAAAFTVMLSLVAFEVFNFVSTDRGLGTFLGGETFLWGTLSWSTILAVAACGIDIAGLIRIFTPETGREEPGWVWLLFGAWLLGGFLNAALTWWTVLTVMEGRSLPTNTLVDRQTLIMYVPVIVAFFVYMTRILIVGSISMAGDHFFNKSAHAPSRAKSPLGVRSATPSQRMPVQQPFPDLIKLAGGNNKVE